MSSGKNRPSQYSHMSSASVQEWVLSRPTDWVTLQSKWQDVMSQNGQDVMKSEGQSLLSTRGIFVWGLGQADLLTLNSE